MFRKLSLDAVTVASGATAALAPTSASAWGWNGGWHHGWGPRAVVGGPLSCGYASSSYGYDGCDVRRLVPTPRAGRWLLVNAATDPFRSKPKVRRGFCVCLDGPTTTEF